ncbi:metallophosphoesterase [Magnetococcales bacterium HHB-1]
MKWSKRIRRFFKRFRRYERVDFLQHRVVLKGREVMVPHFGYPFEIVLGKRGKRLHIYPELNHEDSEQTRAIRYLIVDPDQFFSQASGFLALFPRERVTLGRYDLQQSALFHYPPSVARRHLMIRAYAKKLHVRDLHTGSGSSLRLMIKNKARLRLIEHRQALLKELYALFDAPFQPLPRTEALDRLIRVNAILENEVFRPKNEQGKPGGVVIIPHHLTPILVGDLHARVDNLLTILSSSTLLEGLKKSSCCLIILGDAVHPEADDDLEEMESSLLMMDLIFTLKLNFPERVFYLKGNHDSFSSRLVKGGVPQGALWDKQVRFSRGAQYREEMTRFYKNIPFLAFSDHFVTCHAAAPKSACSLKRLINIHNHQTLRDELIWDRPQNPSHLSGYTQHHVKRLRRVLDLHEDAPFIVGHTPFTREQSYWLNVSDIKNHHVLVSGHPGETAFFMGVNDSLLPQQLPVPPIEIKTQESEG